MLYRTHPFGLEKIVTVDRIGGRIVFAVGDDNQGYVLLGGDHAVAPEQGKRYVMQFTQGGPHGGYWRIMREAPFLPLVINSDHCGKHRYPDKKSAVTAI